MFAGSCLHFFFVADLLHSSQSSPDGGDETFDHLNNLNKGLLACLFVCLSFFKIFFLSGTLASTLRCMSTCFG